MSSDTVKTSLHKYVILCQLTDPIVTALNELSYTYKTLKNFMFSSFITSTGFSHEAEKSLTATKT